MFNSRKMLQIISYLLQLNDNKMDKIKLMKELYLIDRMAINEENMSISGDDYFSLPHGPVLSQTLNILGDIVEGNEWSEYLAVDKHTIVLKKDFDEGRLSKQDKYYINAISDKYKSYAPFELRDYTHQLPEWTDPEGSNRKIYFADIMRALGKSEDEIQDAKEEYDRINDLYSSLGIK